MPARRISVCGGLAYALLIASLGVPALCQEPEWSTLVVPFQEDTVIRVEHPASWAVKVTEQTAGSVSLRFGFEGTANELVLWPRTPAVQASWGNRKSVRRAIEEGVLTEADLSGRSLEELDSLELAGLSQVVTVRGGAAPGKILETRVDEVDGRRRFRIAYDLQALAVDSQDASSPLGLRASVSLRDGNLLVVSYRAYSLAGKSAHERYRDNIETVERVVASLELRDLDEVDIDELWLPHRFDAVRLSQRRDYHLDVQASVSLPASWVVNEIERSDARDGAESGRWVVEMIDPGKGTSSPRLILAADGLEIGPLSRGEFLATARSHLDRLLAPGWTLLATEDVDVDPLRVLARAAAPRSGSTGSTVLSVYEGSAVDGGGQVRVWAYAAGGLTGAVHLFFLVPESELASADDLRRKLVESLGMTFFSPSLQF